MNKWLQKVYKVIAMFFVHKWILYTFPCCSVQKGKILIFWKLQKNWHISSANHWIICVFLTCVNCQTNGALNSYKFREIYLFLFAVSLLQKSSPCPEPWRSKIHFGSGTQNCSNVTDILILKFVMKHSK